MIIPIHTPVLTVPSIDDLCSGATAWTTSGAGETVFIGDTSNNSLGAQFNTSICTDVNCSLQSPQQVLELNISGITARSTATCFVMQLDVLAARIKVTPNLISTESLSTSFQDTAVTIKNTGGTPAIVFSVSFDSSWVSVERIEFLGSGVSFPITLAPRTGELVMTVRSSGTTVEPGTHFANGTITSNVGDEQVQITMERRPAALQVVALPALLATATLSAGFSTSSFFTVYNLQTEQAQWAIGDVITGEGVGNCTAFAGLQSSELPPFSFSDCGGTANHWLAVDGQLQVEIKLTAPDLVGEYTSTTVITGVQLNASLPQSSWNVQSTIRSSNTIGPRSVVFPGVTWN